MYNLEHTSQLDNVLMTLYENPIAFNLGTLGIKLEERKNKIDLNELRRIVRKLMDDGYVQGNESFSLKFEGNVFAEAGGYTAEILKARADASLAQSEIDRRRTLDALLASNSTRLNELTDDLSKATWWAFRAAVAVFIWQIVQFVLEHFVLKRNA